MTGLGICQIRPSSPRGAVSWAMANPCVGRSLTTASTVHSGSDNVGHPLMRPSLEEFAPGSRAVGTVYYAPIGEVVVTGALVTCHLCGRSLRSVTAHLRVHGWTKLDYCEAFGLERGQSLEGPETRKLRAAALTSRLIFEPAMRQGSATGRARA